MSEILKQRLGGWYELLAPEFSKDYMLKLNAELKRIKSSYGGGQVLPKKEQIFRAFELCAPKDVKVVIIGQDPYPHEHANGLAFSTTEITLPASLKNIMKEIEDDVSDGLYLDQDGNLVRWAEQGVLLLNTVLTVTDGIANSHRGLGWEQFTGKAIQYLANSDQPIVWILWGNSAKESYARYAKVENPKHLIIRSVHPSPLSAHNGFFGSKPFSKANDFLKSWELPGIDWTSPAMPF